MHRLTPYFLIAGMLFSGARGVAQRYMRLYPGAIPNAIEAPDKETLTANATVDSLTSHVSIPGLTVFLPKQTRPNGTAVIICPGGGYGTLLTKREGSDVARAFTHSGADVVVPVSNSISFYNAMQRNGVKGALHIYSRGEHGFLTYPPFQVWFDDVIEWMRSEYLIGMGN